MTGWRQDDSGSVSESWIKREVWSLARTSVAGASTYPTRRWRRSLPREESLQ